MAPDSGFYWLLLIPLILQLAGLALAVSADAYISREQPDIPACLTRPIFGKLVVLCFGYADEVPRAERLDREGALLGLLDRKGDKEL